MKIIVQSQAQIEIYGPPTVPHVVVSIRSPGADEAEISRNEHTKDVLFVAFHDVDKAVVLSRPGEEASRTISPITDATATRIWEFVNEHANKVEVLVCQCEAGISRSAGLAAAVSRILTGDDAFFFDKYIPNRAVYAAMMKAAGVETYDPPPKGRSDRVRDLLFT